MDKYIRVKNCNCISDATIEIVEKSLNMMRFYILKRKVNECPTLKEFFNVKE